MRFYNIALRVPAPRPLRPARPPDQATRARRLAYALRTEGSSPARRAAAVGVGVFVGCSPLFGLHFALSYALATLFGLSRATTYLAANVSNPVVAPVLVFAEIQAGSLLRRGATIPISIDGLRAMSPWSFGSDLVVGAIAVGGALGALAAGAVYLGLRRRSSADRFETLAARAAERYVDASITGFEFARGKLRGDPVYRAALCDGLLPPSGTLVDVGCGQGLMLALLLEAAEAWRTGEWTGPPPPLFTTLVGVEPRAGVARLAALATAGAAEIRQIDGRGLTLPSSDAVLFFDVLQMVPSSDQEAMLRLALESLAPHGVVLVREADAASPRFWRVRVGNRAKALVTGGWRQPLCYRDARGWQDLFERLGFTVHRETAVPIGAFGNVLFRLTRPSDVAVVATSGPSA